METKTVKITDFINYQEGSVVSKEIISRPTGTVTFFAFDKGQCLSEHTAPYEALVEVIDGEAEIKIAGKAYQLEAGEIILMPAGQLHAVKALTKFKMVLTLIKS